MDFLYKGFTPDNTMKSGKLVAKNEQEARAILQAKQINVIRLTGKGGMLRKEVNLGHLSDLNRLFLVKHLGIMLQSGIPIYEALGMLKEQSKGKLRAILTSIMESVGSGQTLADSLAAFPKDFPELFVQLIAGGELSGTLEKNLAYIAGFMEKEIDLKKKVKGAMMYPVIVFIAVLLLTMGIGLFVLPQILPLFQSFSIKLPLSTRILIWFAEFFRDYGIVVLIVLIGGAFFTPLFLELKWIKPFSHRIYLRIPVAGSILRELSLARFFRVLATLMDAGLPIDTALNISAKIIRNVRYQKEILKMRRAVTQGNSFTDAVSESHFLFPVLVRHMMRVGEKSGNLVDSLNYLGAFYEDEMDDKLKNLSTLMEPLLLLFIGLIVAFVALSIIGPIYSLSGGIQ